MFWGNKQAEIDECKASIEEFKGDCIRYEEALSRVNERLNLMGVQMVCEHKETNVRDSGGFSFWRECGHCKLSMGNVEPREYAAEVLGRKSLAEQAKEELESKIFALGEENRKLRLQTGCSDSLPPLT